MGEPIGYQVINGQTEIIWLQSNLIDKLCEVLAMHDLLSEELMARVKDVQETKQRWEES